MSAIWIPVIWVLVWMTAAGSSSADWKLVVSHSNDLWFQLDEIQKNDKPCYKDLPPSTSTIETTEVTTSISTTNSMSSTSTTLSTAGFKTTIEDSTPEDTSHSELISSTMAEETSAELDTVQDKIKTSETVRTSKNVKRMAYNIEDELECYGGVARHLTQIKTERNRNKAFLHLNAGGMLGGSIWFPILGSGPAAKSIEKLEYDAIALGYRDFEEGVPATVEYLKEIKKMKQTVLCANMNVSLEPNMTGLFQPSKIIEISGNLIGIVGFIGKDADTMSDTGNIKFEDEVTAINREIGNLFSLNPKPKFIIALGSAGYERANMILDEIDEIDLLISGGGKSVFQWNGSTGPLGETPIDPYPVKKSFKNYERLLVTTPRYGKYLGRIEMDIDGEGHILGHNTFDSHPLLLDKDVIPDEELQGLVDEWERVVIEQSNRTLGYTKLPIISNTATCWFAECTGGSMMADAARWYLEHNYTATNQLWSSSVAACVWHGGALASTNLLNSSGNITLGDILTMFPYHNVLTIATMKGSDILNLMELSVENYNESNYQGEFLHVSGMRVKYDLSRKAGNRVVSIFIRDTSNPAGPLASLALDTVYRIGMPSFIARGGSRYAFMESIKHEDTEINDEIALELFIGVTTPLAYGNDGRVQFISLVDPVNCPHVDVVGTVFLTIFLTLLFMGITFAAYIYLYPKLRDRRGSLLSLVR